MSSARVLIKRNTKMFFKDKGMFFTSLITPGILLVLYVTFLGNVYRDSFVANLPQGYSLPEKLLDGLVSSQLISSMLAVSCVTVAFCTNFLMVQDRANGTIKDLKISPIKPQVLSFSYYIASVASTLIICLVGAAVCLVYVGITGWYMSAADVALLLLDVVLLVLFGTALSSVINFFLSTQGQLSAVGTIVSAGYGFICGAYMPIYSFSDGLQKVVMLLPGTYGTSLMRNHAMRGVLDELLDEGIPNEFVESLKASLDCDLEFFGAQVSMPAMYAVLGGAVAVLIGAYVLMNAFKKKV